MEGAWMSWAPTGKEQEPGMEIITKSKEKGTFPGFYGGTELQQELSRLAKHPQELPSPSSK